MVSDHLNRMNYISRKHKKSPDPRPRHQINGREWIRTIDLTDVNPKNGDHIHNVILLEVKPLTKGDFERHRGVSFAGTRHISFISP